MSKNEIVKQKCPNGHFYNQSLYASCPYCAKIKAAKQEEKTPKDIRAISYRPVNEHTEPSERKAKETDKAFSRYDVPADNPQDTSFDAMNQANVADESRTVSYYSTSSVDPVVGWLVCVKGKNYGECFNLYSGRNEIGRSAGADIALIEEPSISKRTHAVVIFEPRQKQFFIQSGDSHGLTYQNGEIVVSHRQLASMDTITLGDVVFVFMALCNENFDWNDTEKYGR